MAASSNFDVPDFGRILQAIRERWFVALLLATAICAPVGAWLLTRPPVFAATATLRVERTAEQVLEFKQVVDQTIDSQIVDAAVLTAAQELRSHAILSRVVDSLSPGERAQALAPYEGEFLAPGEMELPAEAAERRRLMRMLEKSFISEREGRTLLINGTVFHRDAGMAQLLADRIAGQYIDWTIERSGASNDSALTFVEEQTKRARDELEAAIRARQDYRDANNLVSLGDAHLIGERLKVLNKAVSEVRVARLGLESRLARAEAAGGTPEGARSLASMPEFEAYIALDLRLNESRRERDVLSRRYGRLHPLMVEKTAAIDGMEREMSVLLAAALGDLRNQRDKLLAEEQELEAAIARSEAEALRMDRLIAENDARERAVETRQKIYSELLARQVETGISRKLPNTNIKMVDTAALPERPVKPSRKKIGLVLVVLGGAIFVGFPVAAATLDQRVRTWADLEEELGDSLLGEIGRVSKVAKGDRNRIVLNDLDSPTVEAFRCLHAQLHMRSKLHLPRTILVTSTVPAEGKTFVACNLAASFAAHGSRTLLVDGDFRRPSVHSAFKLENDRGVLSWLASRQAAVGDVVHASELGIATVGPNLFVLPAGGKSGRVTELLQEDGIAQLFGALGREYDVVLVDTPPAGVFPDTDAFARIAGELIYVCRFKAARRGDVGGVLARLRRTDLALAGVVLNGLPVGRAGAAYQSKFGYAGAYRYQKYYSERES